jgi:hypothetical protein
MSMTLKVGLCLLATLSYVLPVSAKELLASSMPADLAMPTPTATPQALFAAQAAKTQEALAVMQTRLAEFVPMQPRNDAIAQSVAAFSDHWDVVVTQYADTQMLVVGTMTTGLHAQHKTQINDFLNAEHLVPELSLFADPMLSNPLATPIDFSNPPLMFAGFFGS